ncbi:MAG: DUF3783 domain-containing protein [Clostridia bacterium]|nr:DUF3783 domain-containing protein [Clostridia bacterium]
MSEPIKTTSAVLAFNFAGVRLANLQALCERNNAELHNVSAKTAPETFSLSLGASLAGGSVTASKPLAVEAVDILRAMTFDEEMLIQAGFGPEELDAVLEDLKKKDLWIPLKAVLTPTNAAWTPVALKAELESERAAIAEAFAKQQEKAQLSVKPGAEQALEDLVKDIEG